MGAYQTYTGPKGAARVPSMERMLGNFPLDASQGLQGGNRLSNILGPLALDHIYCMGYIPLSDPLKYLKGMESCL